MWIILSANVILYKFAPQYFLDFLGFWSVNLSSIGKAFYAFKLIIAVDAG